MVEHSGYKPIGIRFCCISVSLISCERRINRLVIIHNDPTVDRIALDKSRNRCAFLIRLSHLFPSRSRFIPASSGGFSFQAHVRSYKVVIDLRVLLKAPMTLSPSECSVRSFSYVVVLSFCSPSQLHMSCSSIPQCEELFLMRLDRLLTRLLSCGLVCSSLFAARKAYCDF